MPIQILFRKGMQRSLYGEAIEKLLKMKGNLLIISTGYIHDSSYYANKKVVDKIADAIKKSSYKHGLTVFIVGGKQEPIYPQNFKDFCQLLRSKLPQGANVNIQFRRILGDNWHGKVAVKVQAALISECKYDVKYYYAALIGSSNLTPQSTVEGQYGWNRETDLFLVNGSEITQPLNRLEKNTICIKSIEKEIERTKKRIKTSLNNLNKYIPEVLGMDDMWCEDSVDRLRSIFFDNTNNQDAIWGCQSIEQLEYWMKMKKVYEEQIEKLIKKYGDTIEIYNNMNCEILSDLLYGVYERLVDKSKVDIFLVKEMKEIIRDIKKELKKPENNLHRVYLEETIKKLYNEVQDVDKELQVFEPIYELKCEDSYIESIIKGIYIETESIIRNCTKQEIQL